MIITRLSVDSTNPAMLNYSANLGKSNHSKDEVGKILLSLNAVTSHNLINVLKNLAFVALIWYFGGASLGIGSVIRLAPHSCAAQGEIVERGSHEALMMEWGRYYQMYQLQQGEIVNHLDVTHASASHAYIKKSS